jgi:hypothetical protein
LGLNSWKETSNLTEKELFIIKYHQYEEDDIIQAGRYVSIKDNFKRYLSVESNGALTISKIQSEKEIFLLEATNESLLRKFGLLTFNEQHITEKGGLG